MGERRGGRGRRFVEKDTKTLMDGWQKKKDRPHQKINKKKLVKENRRE